MSSVINKALNTSGCWESKRTQCGPMNKSLTLSASQEPRDRTRNLGVSFPLLADPLITASESAQLLQNEFQPFELAFECQNFIIKMTSVTQK